MVYVYRGRRLNKKETLVISYIKFYGSKEVNTVAYGSRIPANSMLGYGDIEIHFLLHNFLPMAGKLIETLTCG